MLGAEQAKFSLLNQGGTSENGQWYASCLHPTLHAIPRHPYNAGLEAVSALRLLPDRLSFKSHLARRALWQPDSHDYGSAECS